MLLNIWESIEFSKVDAGVEITDVVKSQNGQASMEFAVVNGGTENENVVVSQFGQMSLTIWLIMEYPMICLLSVVVLQNGGVSMEFSALMIWVSLEFTKFNTWE